MSQPPESARPTALNTPLTNARSPWRTSRYGFAGFWLLSLMAVWLALRLVLFFQFAPRAPLGDECLAFLSGMCRDFVVALWLSLPLLSWLLLMPDGRFGARWHRSFFWTAGLLFWFVQIFLLFVEYFFFDEFKSRFNTVAVDYLQYPKEVFVNIWDSYHVGVVLFGCLVLAFGWVLAASKLFPGMWERPFSTKSALVRLAAAAALALALAPLLVTAGSLTGVMESPLRLKAAHISNDRTLNEIANNGDLSFFAAAWTHHLDYVAFYKTMPKDEAYERARRLLAAPDTQFLEPGHSIRRRVAGDPARPRLNVVVFLEESFGSEFWGCLGRANTLTPEMDKLAAEEGMLFTNIYASGNRTVRGMEGVLSSFPPLPGDSIVKRDLSDNVETTARILERDGYSTVFLYGGRGVFDGMRSFAVRNGYERFVEQKHFEHATFTTIWGVCDGDLYDRSIEEFRDLAKSGKPFFATILSVSNHKPYTYPRGKIPEDPDQHTRENAVKYSDFALGQFFRAAKKEAFWTNTIFAVVADHGARVYGEQSIPIHSYEIPLLLVGPAVITAPSRIGQLGCSLDVSPTLLGLVRRPYETLFFGHDLLKSPPEDGRALLNHNRDIGLLAHDRMAVLGLMQTVEFYAGDPKRVEIKPLAHPTDSDRELEQDTIAIYQVADDLYLHQRYRLDETPGATPMDAQRK
ncbi:MAG TPA: LTA synthase family protein [Candidatus Acidoferrum sp.]|jgi:phosphoglycerol transferase MdoB-like AlkP superfamily enzyme|nr:LTA synthase family protein [Candidatus Acidoferrum sp.]